jgi:phosphate transport system substrate-binding protein
VVVHPDNPVEALTVLEVAKIYSGEITNWQEVGGKDEPIVVISREEGSGTRDSFEVSVTHLHQREIKPEAFFFDSNGAVSTKVSREPGAIGYISFGYVGAGVKALVIDGAEPTVDNAISGAYPVLRRLYFLTTEIPTGAASAFIDFCRSEEGQKIVAEEGFVPLKR